MVVITPSMDAFFHNNSRQKLNQQNKRESATQCIQRNDKKNTSRSFEALITRVHFVCTKHCSFTSNTQRPLYFRLSILARIANPLIISFIAAQQNLQSTSKRIITVYYFIADDRFKRTNGFSYVYACFTLRTYTCVNDNGFCVDKDALFSRGEDLGNLIDDDSMAVSSAEPAAWSLNVNSSEHCGNRRRTQEVVQTAAEPSEKPSTPERSRAQA